MREIVKKFIQIEEETAREMGAYTFFALLLRENSANRWDIVVASKWINEDKSAARSYLAKKVQDALDVTEIVKISHIAILDNDLFEVPEFLEDVNLQHGSTRFKDEEFSGQQIERGYVITINSNQAA
ncbi:hypothetical protein [Dyadobacter chenhuakuii]|uniref:Uncharacterized protein n=1 Tax=Dyadobacter chenhuakuii TaxID=2909339 RepID=A0ABY4XEP5_9BACT|nr:hypothetical protein [Dyadobacter chenhuakuii]MCF2491957.1 hypothetical protein [Dyadobacter chenhuakuii]USJ28882.1 hypothetical protein NFI80_13455 [Dyadobacter chenhuakuii]